MKLLDHLFQKKMHSPGLEWFSLFTVAKYLIKQHSVAPHCLFVCKVEFLPFSVMA